MTSPPIQNMPTEKQIVDVFQQMRKAQLNPDFASYKNRLDRIKRVHQAILAYKSRLYEAMHADFQKPRAEVDLSEVLPLTSEAKHIKKSLRRWMQDERVAVPVSMIGTPSYIRYEPKGVVLVIAPWNFPFLLTIGPIMSALAAGNSVIVKPSEMTPHTSGLVAELIQEFFSQDEVCVFEGGVETAQLLLKQPFNHIFFTGSPRVGKIVMRAAAENLSSITLELGGKSPVIIDETANIKTAAKRILWAKCLNAGQACISPDYAYVHENVKDAFVEALIETAGEFFEESPQKSAHYARIIDEKNFKRVQGYIDEALKLDAKIEMGGQADPRDHYISPTILTNVSLDSKLMKEEIFGPVLPIQTYSELTEPIQFIRGGEKPLAMYIFSKNRKTIRRVIDETRVGGTCINNCLVHFFNHHLPFGGSNNSGIGKAHGVWGFKAFSNARSVCEQKLPSAGDKLSTPYTSLKQKIIDFTIKWL